MFCCSLSRALAPWRLGVNELRQTISSQKCSWLFVVKVVLFVFIRMSFPGREKILQSRAINAPCKGKKLKRKIVTASRHSPRRGEGEERKGCGQFSLGGDGWGEDGRLI
jgi:hypothetical protein